MERENNLDPYAFDPEEVVGEDFNVLEFQIPFSSQDRLGGVALAKAMGEAEQ